ncbi:MAG: phage tail sheath C-terminal domain-containing protein [Betaproteobacteria bacterium]
MPQYLAPDVYVEEIDTGSKHIEGVSTSIAGMVGVTERGPVDVPVLVTSYGEFANWFGGALPADEFGLHRFLPHAVQGFFTNGGKELYVVRVLDTGLAHAAAAVLFDRTAPAPFADTMLLRTAPESSGTAANPPPLVVMPDANLAQNDWIRIGDGSGAEYRQVALVPVAETVLLPLQLPLGHSHDDGGANNAREFTFVPAGGAIDLTADAAPGARMLQVDGVTADITALNAANVLVRIGGATGEFRYVAGISDIGPSTAGRSRARITLDAPLAFGYAHAVATLQALTLTATGATANLTPAVRAGESLLFVNDRTPFTAGNLLVVDPGTAVQEARLIGELREVQVASATTRPYAAGSLVQVVTLGDDATSQVTAAVGAGPNPIPVSDVRPLRVGQAVLVGHAGAYELHVIATVVPGAAPAGTVTTVAPLAANKVAGDIVVARHMLSADANPGTPFLALTDRSALSVGDVLRLTDGAGEEYVEVAALPLPAPPGVWPNPGNVVLRAPVAGHYARATAQAVRQNAPQPDATLQPSTLALPAATAATQLLVSDATGWTAVAPPGGRFIRVLTPEGGHFYHRVAALGASIAPNPPAGNEARLVTLANPALERSHAAGSIVIERQPLFDVQALDAGAWGNRLRIAIEDEPSGLVSATRFQSVTNATRAHLASLSGIEPGTVLELRQADGTVLGNPVKVASVDRGSAQVTFDAANPLSPAQMGAAPTLSLRSREFRLSVYWYARPDPSAPTRAEPLAPVEVFRNLSMDVRHSRYYQAIIGDIDGPTRLADHRPEGESWYIRVHDPAQDLAEPARTTALQSLRLGPETLVDVLPDGRTRPARQELAAGDDSLGTLGDDGYVGADAADPEQRTGLFCLRNVEDISIIAIPGRTSAAVQGALIEQCESLRYRFAVLDGPAPPDDSLNDVQTQRQQFDTKYAALYHPWLLIPNPFPGTPGAATDYPVPPAGHMLGVYARTDIDRGVHKAPANEVVFGITGLTRIVNKEQQEVLNPYPVNINVIRDFRNASRGIRVYGGRVITSDSDWKYVNVRRLLIFIEASLNRGLQWVVFEPNAEPLWARVRRAITNFLTLVWRNGALEGMKPEEAFFVKCDRTTMTQTDIDSGRLICVVGVAPVKPAEFVIVRIGLWTANADQ